MKISRLLAAFAILTASVLTLSAQNGTMTPYSSYGLGVLRDGATSAQRSMGSVGVAMNSGRQINFMNPASYAAVDSITFLFDMGVDLTQLWQKETTGGENYRENSFGGGLDYVTMQFPIYRNIGASIGLVPFSSVGYGFGSKIDNGIDSRQGSGSINELYAGIAARPFKGFSIGANVSYLFGTIINETYAQISATQSALFQRQMQVRDYRLNFGAQYSLNINKRDRLTVGLTFSPGKDLHGTSRSVNYDTANESTPEYSDESKLQGAYSIPLTWAAGINYDFDRKLMVEFDYLYQPWSKAKFANFTNFDYANRTKYGVGLQYTPDYRGGYFKRINYRIGANYCDDYMRIKGNQLREYSITAGFGFPVPSLKTTVNLGVEWMTRKAHPNPLIKENYLNITFGINFNEMWFNQSKIY